MKLYIESTQWTHDVKTKKNNVLCLPFFLAGSTTWFSLEIIFIKYSAKQYTHEWRYWIARNNKHIVYNFFFVVHSFFYETLARHLQCKDDWVSAPAAQERANNEDWTTEQEYETYFHKKLRTNIRYNYISFRHFYVLLHLTIRKKKPNKNVWNNIQKK